MKRKTLKAVFSALLCVPLVLGVLAGCGGDPTGGGETPEEPDKPVTDPATEQTTVKDSEALTYSMFSDTVNNDAYAKNALDKEVEYLLSFDSERLLFYFYRNAGLRSSVSEPYGGWEDSLIAGHAVGHYFSAIAQAYANPGTSEPDKTALGRMISSIVLSLQECQQAAPENHVGAKEGFIWGGKNVYPSDVEFQFNNVEAGKTDISSQAWVPWYTMHKILAGLLDLYTLAGNETALEIAENLGSWVYERVMKWNDATRKTVLSIEYGGMNDCLYNLYALTGEEKFAVAAHKFDEDIPTQGSFAQKAMTDRIIDEDRNYLQGQHANTTIPKVIGLLNGYIQTRGKQIEGVTVDVDVTKTGVSDFLEVAEKFWERVVSHHSYVTGGNSKDEHFQADDSQWTNRSNVNCETCNTYNMLKLSRMLFTLTGEKKYLDYYENTYINAILSSQDPETGMTMYFQPMASGYFKVYSSPFDHFWCCTGSGMESMSKLQDSIYYSAGNATYVAMYMSSTYQTDAVSLTMTADLENSDKVTVHVDGGQTVLRLRRPDWAKSFEVTVEGNAIPVQDTDDFVSVEVHKGETIEIKAEKTFTAHTLPDGKNVFAFKYGPYVLSRRLGTENMETEGHGVQVLKPAKAVIDKGTFELPVTSEEFVSHLGNYFTKNGDGTFTLRIGDEALTYVLHYKQHTNRYAIYQTFVGKEGGVQDTPAEEEIEAVIQPGRGQYEGNGFFEDNGSEGGDGVGRYARANGSFSYFVAVNKSKANQNYIVTALAKADNGKTLLMRAGGKVLYSGTLGYTGEGDLYDLYVPIPESVVRSAEKNTLNGSEKDRIKVTVSAVNAGEASAALHTYFKTVTREGGERDENIAYFVDCGDYDPATLAAGDKFGMYNSVTDQVYGADPVTGRMWGIVDDYPTDIAGECTQGIGTNSTWAYEFAAADGSKTDTNRYTKNQYENGVQTFKLSYKFALADGTYSVKVYFVDPWGCSQNPSVSANGTLLQSNCAMNTEITLTVTVTGGELQLDFTSQKNDSTQKCINLCYIEIDFA